MAVPMPPVVVLIVCKVVLGAPDDNSAYTGWRASEFDTTGGVMHCKRSEVQLYDPAVDQGADEQPFTAFQCARAGVMLGTQFDRDHTNQPWRFWRAACPVAIVNEQGVVVGWKIPECPESYGTVKCESDSVI